MLQIILMGLGAGAAAALVFGSVASGSALAFSLFYLAPLPILIVGLGWSHWAALIAAAAAAVLLAIEEALVSLAFLIGIALPGWCLSYLALLARPVAEGLEWYPVGRLVLWAAVISALIVGALLVGMGPDAETLRATLHEAIQTLVAGVASGVDSP